MPFLDLQNIIVQGKFSLVPTGVGSRFTMSALTPQISVTTPNTNFGTSVAIDGDTMVVGFPSTNANASIAIFARDGDFWTLLHRKVKPSNQNLTVTAQFGYAVDIKDDLIVVGAPLTTTTVPTQQTYIALAYRRVGGSWANEPTEHRLTSTPNALGGAGTWFGSSVATNGTDVIVGVKGQNSNMGAAAYYANPTLATQTLTIRVPLGTLPTSNCVGFSMWYRGNKLLIGGNGNLNESSIGATAQVLYLTHVGSTFTLHQNIQSENTNGIGCSIHVCADGNLFLGTPGASADAGNKGGFNEYHLNTSTNQWQLVSSVTIGNDLSLNPTVYDAVMDNATTQRIGWSIATTANCNVAVIGAPGYISSGATGALFVVERTGGVWGPSGITGSKLLSMPLTANERFGHAVAYSPNSQTFVVGSPGTANVTVFK